MLIKITSLIRNERGSVVEAIAGGALLIVLAAAIYPSMKNSYRAQREIDHDQKLSAFHTALSKTLQNVNHCNATFSNQALASATSLVAPTSIYLADSTQTTYTGMKSAETLRAPTPMISVNDWISASREWRIIGFAFKTSPITSATPTVERQLVVTYQLNPNIRSKTIAKSILLGFAFNRSTNVFEECLDPRAETVNTFQESVCFGMSGEAFDSTGGSTIAEFDPITGECKLKNNVLTCPPGQVVRGVKADGTVSCMHTDEGVDSRIPSPGVTNCAAGERMRISYSGGVMSITCAP